MALEDLTGTKYIDDLNSSNPAAGDNVSEGDDHIRGIKNVLKTTFPNIDGAVNATDTELNYVDGVTSAVQTQFDAITANDWVTSARIADDAITSALIADDAITSALIADDAVVQAAIADEAVDEARLQVSNAGSNGQFLSKQSGDDGGLTWATVSSEDYIPDGSVMAFFQASAPTGWTQVTTQNDKMLRVVSGTGGGTGGSAAVSSPAHNIAAAAHTLATSEMPAHTHGSVGTSLGTSSIRAGGNGNWYSLGTSLSTGSSGSTGGGGSHSHNTSGSITTPQYIDVIICSKDA